MLLRNGAMITLLFLVGCGSGVMNSTESPKLSEMPFAVTTDVGENLVRHFTQNATKPPVGRQLPARTYRFDFVETERTLSPDGNGIIRGNFLFSINNQTPQKGLIELVYTPDGPIWRKTNQVHIAQTDVEAIQLLANIRDGESGQPLQNVAVEARRADGVRTSRTVQTDEAGLAVLEVLPGEFEIAVDHPNFQPLTQTTVHADMAQIQLDDIQLVPINKLTRTP